MENINTAETLFYEYSIHPNSLHITVRQFRKTFGYVAGNLVAIDEFIKRTQRKRRPRKNEVTLYPNPLNPRIR